MAIIGCLGAVVFTVSDKTIETIDKVKWSGSARYAVHQRHLYHSLTEFTGIAPDKMSFSITLSAYLGVNPMDELVKLWKYERSGEAVPLTIGEKAYGKYRWSVLSHDAQLKVFDKFGNLMSADVSVSLQEYLSV